MRAVSNTSPLSNLAIIGRLDLIRQRYGAVQIPPAVATELSRLMHPAAKASLSKATQEHWLITTPLTIALPQLPSTLDPGEHEAIALALELKADVLLMDEKRGRTAARAVGLTVAGVLGELLHAKLQGWLPALRPEMEHLHTKAGFFIDPAIEQFILSQAGE